MKFKSKLKTVDIEPKNIILYKHTYNAITTEDYFQIDEQPKNTCPLIDSALRELEDKSNTDGLKILYLILKALLIKNLKNKIILLVIVMSIIKKIFEKQKYLLRVAKILLIILKYLKKTLKH